MSAPPARILRRAARDIARRLQEAGYPAFWVGGCVRDALLGRPPGDYDLATAARPEQIERLFPRTLAVGRKFGVMVVLEAGCQFQVATFRAEADYQDGRRPGRVAFGDARADALRRDFTVNGLFYDPVRRRLHDWVGGAADDVASAFGASGLPGLEAYRLPGCGLGNCQGRRLGLGCRGRALKALRARKLNTKGSAPHD